MRFLERFSRGQFSLTRTEAFSDAVFAIIVTLLVLELKVRQLKDATSVGELGHALVELAPKFVSWLISFIIVCKFWLNHHHLLGLARHANYGMMWLNSLFPLGQSFMPFPTALAGEYRHNALAVSFFGIVFALNTFLFFAAQRLYPAQPAQAGIHGPSGSQRGDQEPDRPGVLSHRRIARLGEHPCRVRGLCGHAAILHHAVERACRARRRDTHVVEAAALTVTVSRPAGCAVQPVAAAAAIQHPSRWWPAG